MAERSKARVCGRSFAGIVGSNPAGDMDVHVVCVVQYGHRTTDKVQRENKKNPDEGEIFRTPLDMPWGQHSLLHKGVGLLSRG